MKTIQLKPLLLALTMAATLSCTNQNKSGQNMSPEGTTQNNRVNSEMEDQRTPADVDTVTSPGSNALDLKASPNSSNSPSNNGEGRSTNDNSNTSPSVTPGSGHDANMAGQSDTHGRKTTAGNK